MMEKIQNTEFIIILIKSNKLKEVIKKSTELEYRLIDTAFIYENESEIGEILEEIMNSGIVKRKDLLIVSKKEVKNKFNVLDQQEDDVPKLHVDGSP
ncbi:hypothetical protein PGB90_002411 [Kerria lacca]